jgi:hypothetical protein
VSFCLVWKSIEQSLGECVGVDGDGNWVRFVNVSI